MKRFDLATYLDRATAFAQMAWHLDDQQAPLFRALVRQTLRRIYEHKFPESIWWEGGLIPINTQLHEGTGEFEFLEMEDIGAAEVVAESGDDLPSSDIVGDSEVRKVRTVATSFSFTTQDVRAAQLQGIYSIAERKSLSARRNFSRLMHTLVERGNSNRGLRGMVTHEGIMVRDAVKVWRDIGGGEATGDEIVAEFGKLVSEMRDATDGIFEPNTALFPHAVWGRISSVPRNVQAGDTTILQFLRNNHPNITRWEPVWSLKDVADNGGHSVFLYDRNAMNAEGQYPMALRPQPPQQQNLKIKVPMEGRWGGIVMPQPKAHLRIDGV